MRVQPASPHILRSGTMVKKVLKNDVVASEQSPESAEASPVKVKKDKVVKLSDAKKAAKPAKAAKAAKVEKPAKDKKESVRVRSLKAIQANKNGLTATEVKVAIGLGHGLKPTLDQEVERGHLKNAPHKDDKEVAVYVITAAGSQALKAGTVDQRVKSE